MTDLMQRCMEWMMSLGVAGMALVFILLIGLIVLVAVLIARAWPGPRR